jgi:prepilin-type N-terminal cleavage/methylation domain-containing protein
MIKNFKKKKNNKGFTLVELLVVIAIIGVLAVVAVPSLMQNVNKAKAADAVSYISAARTTAISEYATNTTIPTNTTIQGLVEDKPESVSSIGTIVNGTTTTIHDGYVVMPVTVTSEEIAKRVKEQMGSNVATYSGSIVTVNLFKGSIPSNG